MPAKSRNTRICGRIPLIEAALTAAIVEHAEDAIIAKRLDGTVIRWNAGAERIFGYSAADMLGGPITRLFPPDLLHEEPELIGRLKRGEAVHHFSTRRIRKDGASIDVSVSLSPVRDAGGTIVAVSKIARDVTEVHRVQLSAALSTAIIEHSDDAIISKTVDGKVLTWNPGAERVFGYSPAQMIGTSITDFFRRTVCMRRPISWRNCGSAGRSPTSKPSGCAGTASPSTCP